MKYKICSHIHTHHSHDSKLSVEEIFERSEKMGYTHIIITDHDSTEGAREALEYKEKMGADLQIIIGAEMSTNRGHILVFPVPLGFENTIERIHPYGNSKGKFYDIFETISAARDLGAMLFLAHPVVSAVDENNDFLHLLDGFEIVNSRVEASFSNAKSSTLIDKIMDQKYALIAGCDAHSAGEIGNAYMEINAGAEGFCIRSAMMGAKTVYHRSPCRTAVSYNKLMQNKKGMGYAFRQLAKILISIPLDLTRNKGYRQIKVAAAEIRGDGEIDDAETGGEDEVDDAEIGGGSD